MAARFGQQRSTVHLPSSDCRWVPSEKDREIRLLKSATVNQPRIFHSGPSEPFTSTNQVGRVLVSRIRGRAVQLAPQDSKELWGFFWIAVGCSPIRVPQRGGNSECAKVMKPS